MRILCQVYILLVRRKSELKNLLLNSKTMQQISLNWIYLAPVEDIGAYMNILPLSILDLCEKLVILALYSSWQLSNSSGSCR